MGSSYFPTLSIRIVTSHAITATVTGDDRYLVTLKDTSTAANRDFVLRWRLDTGDAPFAALFREVKDGDTYILAVVAPPSTIPVAYYPG